MAISSTGWTPLAIIGEVRPLEDPDLAAVSQANVLPLVLGRGVVPSHSPAVLQPRRQMDLAVMVDNNGSLPKAKEAGTASVNGFHADLTVTLDLLNLTERACSLTKTRQADRA